MVLHVSSAGVLNELQYLHNRLHLSAVINGSFTMERLTFLVQPVCPAWGMACAWDHSSISSHQPSVSAWVQVVRAL